MNEPVENLFFNWLCAKVVHVEVPTPSLSYWRLLKQLHDTEFVWLLSGDDNRAEDGVDLRSEFCKEAYLHVDPLWMSLPCSTFEMLYAFARRASFDTDQESAFWFWRFLDNLGLKRFNDAAGDRSAEIADILDRFLWRNYNSNGNGGICPLRAPQHDQRKVELWYQFCEYLVDQYP